MEAHVYGLHFKLPPLLKEPHPATLAGVNELCHCGYLVAGFLEAFHYEFAHQAASWACLILLGFTGATHYINFVSKE